MIHVYLDDFRKCPQGFTAAKTAEECKLLIEAGPIGVLSLDYDLGWGEPTGYEVARHLVEIGKYPQEIYLHTSSDAGRMQMYELLSRHIPDGVKLFGGPMREERLREVAEGRGI
ncbi:cyclic-phosphate processing receiver domain-containing protein [Paenibacillus beijingensis]|uniref:Cell division protein FtsJ n=1 Tax=Paenibacillus beijingensis TaxID=1126833 RepID=A0A0D5NP13_9BACL|nr:cyclic-phosphate processing receiver domain-containing protein [Paenibacillus beijingensis]AJY77064.1 cell division protein FtsJ [Paenibacillus beijingensis]